MSNEINYHRFSDEHLDSTMDLIREILEGEFDFDFSAGYSGYDKDILDIETEYFSAGGGFWLATSENDVIGTIGLHKTCDERACIKRFYVKKEYRGKGIGGNLFKELLMHAKEGKIGEIYVSTLENMREAIEFYLRKGFQPIPQMPPDMPRYIDTEYFRLNLGG